MLMQRSRDTGAALRLLGKLMRSQPVEPESIVTDGLRSYKTALSKLGTSIIPGGCGRTIGRRTAPPDQATRTQVARVQVPSLRPAVLATHAAIHNTFTNERQLNRRAEMRRLRASPTRRGR